jgi:hypothetical protein
MGRINDYVKYTCHGYRYAPESFRVYKVFVNKDGYGKHKYVELDLSAEQRSNIGNTYICKGKKAAFDLAKRYDREMMRKRQIFITYGFSDVANPSHYYFTQQLFCRLDAPLLERYFIFKKFRDYLAEDNGYTVTTQQLDGAFMPVNAAKKVKRPRSNANLLKPVVVYLKAD